LGIDLHQAPIAMRLLYLALAFFKSRGEHEGRSRSGPGWITGDLLRRRSASTGICTIFRCNPSRFPSHS
jgi:hypothetical protein